MHKKSRWAYALRTELGDGAGHEAIRETIEHLVANLTSEQWAREKCVYKLNLKLIDLFWQI